MGGRHEVAMIVEGLHDEGPFLRIVQVCATCRIIVSERTVDIRDRDANLDALAENAAMVDGEAWLRHCGMTVQ